MKITDKKTLKLEESLYNNPSVKNTIGVSLIYYKEYLSGNKEYLAKALRVVSGVYENNVSSVDLLLISAFYNIENGSIDNGELILNKFKPYKNYYKSLYPIIYGIYLYITAIIEIKSNKEKRVSKIIKSILELTEKDKTYIYELLIGDLYARLEKYDLAFECLEKVYFKGSNSFMMYSVLYNMAKKGIEFTHGGLLSSFLQWCNKGKILEDYFLDDNKVLILDILEDYVDLFGQIYESHPIDWILIEICNRKIAMRDSSIKAYEILKKAENKQLSIVYLEKALAESAYYNNIDDISVHSISNLIENYKIDGELLVFIYHLILTKKKLYHLIDEFNLKGEIINLATNCFKNDKRGRIYNSIYKYALEHLPEIQNDLKVLIAQTIYEDLFNYTVKCSQINSGILWIFEKELMQMEAYKIENGTCSIKLNTGNFKYVLLSNNQKNILDDEVMFEKQVENADIWLYNYYIIEGYSNRDLYIALSSYAINLEMPKDTHIDILKKTIALPNLSQGFRMQISATLGNVLAMQHRYNKALEYFKEVDENSLNEKYIEAMLTAFINAKEYENALRIILKKGEYITNRTLFLALKEMAHIERIAPFLADPAYALILNNYYDNKLLEIVLNHYNGSQEEWLILNNTLLSMSVVEQDLDEIILNNSIWMHDFSESSQMVFINMYKSNPENELVKKFTYYACFEMLINLAKPEYEVLVILEKIQINENNRLLAYALTRIYFEHNIVSYNSEEIVKKVLVFMEEDRVILPEFKKTKDKSIQTAYIEKYKPFIYRCAKGKKVLLYFKYENDLDFRYIEMEYKIFGIFSALLPIFYNEKIEYYFSEEIITGSINTKIESFTNIRVSIKPDTKDSYFLINNALIYDQMFKYDEAEKVITGLLNEKSNIIGKLL